MSSLRFVPIVLFIMGNGIQAQEEALISSSPIPGWTQRIDVLEGTATGRVFPWNIISGTRPPGLRQPLEGLQDFANRNNRFLKDYSASSDRSANSSPDGPLWDRDYRTTDSGEEVPAYWESVAPATYTLVFATPVEIHRIDLAPPLRKIGFSDFEVLLQRVRDKDFHPIIIEEATISRGLTIDAGYLWEFRIEPEKILRMRIEFKKGTLDFPDRIFLKDLDVWGK